MAEVGWEVGADLADEKGPAPIMNEEFLVTEEMLARRPEMRRDGYARRSGEARALSVEGGTAHAAALHPVGSRHRIQA